MQLVHTRISFTVLFLVFTPLAKMLDVNKIIYILKNRLNLGEKSTIVMVICTILMY